MTSFSAVMGRLVAWYALAFKLSKSAAFTFTADDFWPTIPPGSYYYRRWGLMPEKCTGSGVAVAASECGFKTFTVHQAKENRAILTLPAAHEGEDPYTPYLYQIFPVLTANPKVAMVGEWTKYVPMSHDRFTDILVTNSTLTASLSGLVSEKIIVACIIEGKLVTREGIIGSNKKVGVTC